MADWAWWEAQDYIHTVSQIIVLRCNRRRWKKFVPDGAAMFQQKVGPGTKLGACVPFLRPLHTFKRLYLGDLTSSTICKYNICELKNGAEKKTRNPSPIPRLHVTPIRPHRKKRCNRGIDGNVRSAEPCPCELFTRRQRHGTYERAQQALVHTVRTRHSSRGK